MSKSAERIYVEDLAWGELYRTTERMTWSDWDNNNEHISVSGDETIMFRSFQPYPTKEDKNAQLALFVWLKEKKTICLMVSKKHCSISLKHIPWEKRHINLTEK